MMSHLFSRCEFHTASKEEAKGQYQTTLYTNISIVLDPQPRKLLFPVCVQGTVALVSATGSSTLLESPKF